MGMITKLDLEHWFTYHPPQTDKEVAAYEDIRAAGYNLAEIILENTPEGADQSAAIRLVRQSVMQANAAIACRGR
jgi:hypothetical protein